MKDKLVNIIKKYWVIPISILLWYFPIMPIGMVIWSIIALTTGSEYISAIISILGISAMSSIPIILKLRKAETLKRRTKCLIIVATILVFAFLTCLLTMVNI